MTPREQYQDDSASEYETEMGVDNQETETGKKGKKPYKKRKAFAEQRKLQRWDADKDQLLLLVTDNVMGAIGRPLPWDVIAKHISPNISGESIKQHLTKVLQTREAAGLPVPTKMSKGSQKKDNDQVEANLAELAIRAKENNLCGKDAGFVPRDVNGRNFNAAWFNEMTPVKNAGLLHLPYQSTSKGIKKDVEAIETPVKTTRNQVVLPTPKAEALRRFQQPSPPAMTRSQIDEAVARERAQDIQIPGVVKYQKTSAQFGGVGDDVFGGPATKKSTPKKSTPKASATTESDKEKPTAGTKRSRKSKTFDADEGDEYQDSPKKQKRGLRKKPEISYTEEASPEATDDLFDNGISSAQVDVRDHGRESMLGFPEDFGHMSAVPRTLPAEVWPPAYELYSGFNPVNAEFHGNNDAFEGNQLVFRALPSGMSENAMGGDSQQRNTEETLSHTGLPMPPNLGYAGYHGNSLPAYIGSAQNYSYSMSTGNPFNHGQSFDSSSSGNDLFDALAPAPDTSSFSTNGGGFDGHDASLPCLSHLNEPLTQASSLTAESSFSDSHAQSANLQRTPNLAKSNSFESLWGNPVQVGSDPDELFFPGLFKDDLGV